MWQRALAVSCILSVVFIASSLNANERRFAVLVGIDNYDDPAIPDLEVAVADVRRLGALLKTNCKFDVVRELFDNHSGEKSLPTREYIDKAIREVLFDAGPDDTVVIFYSGHGFTDAQGEAFLAPQDCRKIKPDIGGYRTAELVDVIRRCQAARKILILDCCHAGGAGATSTGGPIAAKFSGLPGLVLLASCQADELSQQWIQMGQSVFTFHLLRGLEGAADANSDGAIDTQELHEYVSPRVSRTAQMISAKRQSPIKVPSYEPKPAIFTTPSGFVNVIGMAMARIKRGAFTMGSAPSEGGDLDESPRGVDIMYDFYIGQHEVTQQQFAAIMGRNPSHFFGVTSGEDFGSAEKRPVESMTFVDAEEFCRRLSQSPQEREAGRSYRLPTEKEWEYACRAGSTSAVVYGDSISSWQANFDGNYPWGSQFVVGPDRNVTTMVGTFKANDWGLFDMHGNVWEWCSDWLDEQEQSDRVIRGGGWDSLGSSCRSARRGGFTSGRGRNDIGFRVVCKYVY